MSKKIVNKVLLTLDDYGITLDKLEVSAESIGKAIEQLRSQAYVEGFNAGLVEGRNGSRAIESYGHTIPSIAVPGKSGELEFRAETAGVPPPKLSMTQRRHINALVELENWPDPIKRRKRDGIVKVKSRARLSR